MKPDQNSQLFAWSLIDIALLIFASGTFSYEIVLITRLPIWHWYPCALLCAILFSLVQFRIENRIWRSIQFDSEVLMLIGFGIFCALINVFTLRPDADDFSYFHRALYALSDLSAPISIFNNSHDIKSLPALSPVFLTSSLEVTEALTAKALHISPLFFYQQIGGALSLFIFPFIFFLFFRYLDFSTQLSFAGIALIIFLYIFSGDSHQDWGNFTFVRAWQGKCILITLLAPLTILATYTYIQYGSAIALFRLHLVCISGIGLSGTAFFLIPFTIGLSILGTTTFQFTQKNFLRRCIYLSSTLIFFLILVIVIKTGGLPDISNTDVWKIPFNEKIRPELEMLNRTIFVQKTTLYFYLLSVFGILWFHRTNVKVRSITAYSVLVCLFITIPPVSSLLIKVTLAGAFWRLAYASQIPLIISIFTLLCFSSNHDSQKSKTLSQITCGILIIFTFAFFKTPAVKKGVMSTPQSFKFPIQDVEFETLIDKTIPIGSVAAMPEDLVPTIGLLRPDIGFISTRSLETMHVFINVNRSDEARWRNLSQLELTLCGKGGELKRFLSEHQNLKVMVFPEKCEPKQIALNLSINDSHWAITHTSKYQLWVNKF